VVRFSAVPASVEYAADVATPGVWRLESLRMMRNRDGFTS
jgi:hypothetical protein